jgi:toxin ParE1/3/4
MIVKFDDGAESEFLEAVAFYAAQEPTLGGDFMSEVLAAVGRIAERPLSWPQYTENTRRHFTRRFPYSVVYSIESDTVVIWAVAHTSRDEFYWSDRPN